MSNFSNLESLGGYGIIAGRKMRYLPTGIENPYMQKIDTPWEGIKETPILATAFGIGPKAPSKERQPHMVPVTRKALGLGESNSLLC